jgi:hypothetical protein
MLVVWPLTAIVILSAFFKMLSNVFARDAS